MAFLTATPCPSTRAAGQSWGRGNPRALLGVLLVMAVVSAVAIPAPCAGETTPTEYQVKAAFLVNFPKYAEWPAEAFAETNSPVVIAVLGESKVGEEVQRIVAGRTVNGRELVVRRLASGEEPAGCHILFISAVEHQRSPDRCARLKGRSVLTVGESTGFLEGGGIINLGLRGQKVALEVNLAAAAGARITISSKLLKVASVVQGQAK